MDFLERDLEDILFRSNQNDIFERGLDHFYFDRIYRQVRINNYGIIDLLTIMSAPKEKTFTIVIYELKNKKISSETFWQLLRYIKAVKHVLSGFNLKNHKFKVWGVMVGREMDLSNDFCYIPTINSDISIYTYEYKIDGIRFNMEQDFYMKNGYKHDFNFTQLDGEANDFEAIRTMLKPKLDPPF